MTSYAPCLHGRDGIEASAAPGRPDPDLLQRLIHHDGVPPARVGARIGRSRAAGYSWLRRYGIRSGNCPLWQRELVAAWRSGRSLADLSNKHFLPITAIRERLVTAGVCIGTRNYLLVEAPDDPLNEPLLRDMAAQDLSAERIAELTGTTPRQVRYRLRLFGIFRGKPSPPPVRRQRP